MVHPPQTFNCHSPLLQLSTRFTLQGSMLVRTAVLTINIHPKRPATSCSEHHSFLDSHLDLRNPRIKLRSGRVVRHICSVGHGHVLLVFRQRICSHSLLVSWQVVRSRVGSVSQPVVPPGLHSGDVNSPIGVLNPSCSEVDFLGCICFVILVTPVVSSHQPSSFGVVVDLDLPGGSSDSRGVDVFKCTENGG